MEIGITVAMELTAVIINISETSYDADLTCCEKVTGKMKILIYSTG